MSEHRVFTFGDGQAFPNGYVVIDEATNIFGSEREVMTRVFGSRWSMEYDTEDAAGVSQYGLIKVEICTYCWGCKTPPWNLDAMDGVALFCPTIFDPNFRCLR